MVRSLEQIAAALPPLQEVIDYLDAKEMEDERNGRPYPKAAWETLRPILVAARDFQAACLKTRADWTERQRAAAPPAPINFSIPQPES